MKLKFVNGMNIYEAFFIYSFVFISIGISFTATVNAGFFGIMVFGLILLFTSIANKDKWNDKNV